MATPLVFTESSSPRHQPVAAVAREVTEDRKLSVDKRHHKVSVTATSQFSCDPDCPFMGAGCYAEGGPMGYLTRRLNSHDRDHESSPEEIAAAEAAAIRKLSGRNPLRLKTVGDCRTNEAVAIVREAVDEYKSKHGSAVWSYTHAWRKVDRAAWGDTSVLASCETEDDVRKATTAGWGVAVVFNQGEMPKEYGGLRVIPCLQQTGVAADCYSCTYNKAEDKSAPLCSKDDRLKGKALIGLSAHGATKRVRAALAARKDA